MGVFGDLKVSRMGAQAVELHSKGNELVKQGRLADAEVKFNEAMQQYKAAYEAGNRRLNTMMAYAVLMMRYGQFAEARELMKEISSTCKMDDNTHCELRINYSLCLWRLGLLEDAIKTIRYAGKHMKNSEYYSYLCTYLVDQAGGTGEFAEAKAALDEAMDYDDEDAATLDNYGEYYRQMMLWAEKNGDADAAKENRAKSIEYYEKALAQRPGQITTLYALSGFAIEDGDREKARQMLDKAILRSGSKLCPITTEMLRARRAQAE